MYIIPVLGYLFYLPYSALHPVFRHTDILFLVHVFTSMHTSFVYFPAYPNAHISRHLFHL